jgi:two-component system nitrate/nitrite sensor histidine kinase NarX
MTAPEIRDLRRVIDHVVEVVGGALNCDVYLMIPGHHISEGTDVFSLMSGADIGTDRNAVVAFNEGPGGREGYITGLLADARHLGSLAVSRPHGSPFSAADASMLRALSAQTALLLERSLLYEEVAAGAILEERSRLAREIHDGLAQHLAFLKMHVAWLQRSTGRVESQQLNSIENVLATALTEARQAITTLRVDAKATTTAEAIASYLEEFGRISDLKLFVRQDDHLPEVGPKARVELLRIVQESLNNVRKHAGATDVSVLMTTAGGRFTICVSDNGKGFDTAGNREGHFGVAIMRERAESVGGKLVVKSGSGRGTTVEVSVPVPPQPELLSG